MKILSPINNPAEVIPVIEAGAGELYCGVLASDWRRKYTNIASINRREWSTSNLTSYEELEQVVELAHGRGVPVFLTLNALYTAPQYERLLRHLERIRKISLDGLIVADMGLLLTLREMNWPTEIHISTGGTTFNSHTARFYYSLGAKRLVLPRHHSAGEIINLARKIDFMDKECFIFNAGCKNIDGFCTYHHGVNEILHKGSWKFPKRLGLDQAFYKCLRCIPDSSAVALTRFLGGNPDSACLLNYKIKMFASSGDPEAEKRAVRWLESTFNAYSGLDPCGACDLLAFRNAGLCSVKIVGRENPSWKKIRDVGFLGRTLRFLEEKNPGEEEYIAFCQEEYKRSIGVPCRSWCYYPKTGKGSTRKREEVTV